MSTTIVNLVNLTPHAITLRVGGVDTAYPSEGVARVGSTPGERIPDQGLPLYTAPTWGEVEGLPGPKDGTIYIVSSVVAAHCGGRPDVFAPGTGPKDEAIRDDEGQVVAVTRLIQSPQADG